MYSMNLINVYFLFILEDLCCIFLFVRFVFTYTLFMIIIIEINVHFIVLIMNFQAGRRLDARGCDQRW